MHGVTDKNLGGGRNNLPYASLPADETDRIARLLLADDQVAPIGLGARDSLRLEAGLCLYGNDIDETTTPVDANLKWAIQKVRRKGGAREGGFPGADVILPQFENGASRIRVGLQPTGKAPVRAGAALFETDSGGEAIGTVTATPLKQWIAQGAEYEPHWAYVRPERHALPQVKGSKRVRNAIDNFILAELEKRRWQPSEEADRHAIIRRVSLDLTGLPPTTAEIKKFLTDKSMDAYPKLVDRLLAKPTYGEHWARQWLDLARYADSAGYADDQPALSA